MDGDYFSVLKVKKHHDYSIESIDKIWTSLEYMHTYCIRWWSNKESCKNAFTWQNVTDKNETALTTWHQYKSGILWVGLWRNLTFLSECQIFGSTMAGQCFRTQISIRGSPGYISDSSLDSGTRYSLFS